MRVLWPVIDPIQAEYESLRTLALADAELAGPIASRFVQQGLAGLIAWRRAEPSFSVTMIGAKRPPWTPYSDPRLDALAAVYQLVLELCSERTEAAGVRR